jgi:hypothetical protein
MATNGKSRGIEGAPSKAYKLYRTGLNGEIIGLVAEADTLEELGKLHMRRLDWHYKLYHKGKPMD